MVNLTLLYLTGNSEDFSGFYKPGAVHKARFRGKLLYSIKIVLLTESTIDIVKLQRHSDATAIPRLKAKKTPGKDKPRKRSAAWPQT